MSVRITWLGHASVKIEAPPTVIYLDPWKVVGPQRAADAILITHAHHDHFSPEDVRRLSRPGTRVVAPMNDALVTDCIAVGEILQFAGFSVEALPAYNTDKDFHPRDNGWVGYIVSIGGQRIYHAGDTDVIPEMQGLKVDVALLPVGGTYTMRPEECLKALADIAPGRVIPIHFGDIVGTRADAERLLDNGICPVHILEGEESIEVG